MAIVIKNLPVSAGDVRDLGSISRSGRSPGRGHGTPLQYFCLENPHGQRSLVGYSPWGHKESDTAEVTSHTHTHTHTHTQRRLRLAVSLREKWEFTRTGAGCLQGGRK